ncbi:hypothetical protein T440DRAFT_290451 [Plenodomus tracheiphilus IPT5]|uniref:F-box domain-containing protein n=1 Tax=Plenodomus tracheiphilus IPT5 TaxID=1408161 RepID=A0A6A7BGI8_9PLEO|nr:hypothetical protein T440DRAFT_290451 [Plenodomus tracheiphilus IPT5]
MSTLPTMHPFKILNLPPEIVGNICECLDDIDLLHVRRVCKAVEAHSSTAFGKRFFHHLVAILHPTSLTTLLEIARHNVLSKFVRKVTMSGELIGQTIRSLDNDEQRHAGMQKSVANSGLDTMILTEVFRALKSIQVVSIDMGSFNNAEYFGVDEEGLKCGRLHMHIHPKNPEYDHTATDFSVSNRIYGIVLEALHQARISENDRLELLFSPNEHGDGPLSFFDLTSAEWINFLSKKVQKISYGGFMDPRWVADLLRTTPNIHEFYLGGFESIVTLPISTVGTCHWARLRRLGLDELYLWHNEFKSLLYRHYGTLEHLHLQEVGLAGGTWVEPLEIIRDMKQLGFLFLNGLLESTSYHTSGQSFDQYEDPDDSDSGEMLLGLDYEDIQIAMNALLNDLATKSLGIEHIIAESTVDETCFHQKVDLRKAVAANEGRIRFFAGKWIQDYWTFDDTSSANTGAFSSEPDSAEAREDEQEGELNDEADSE